jgi:hypothetical protein
MAVVERSECALFGGVALTHDSADEPRPVPRRGIRRPSRLRSLAAARWPFARPVRRGDYRCAGAVGAVSNRATSY